MVERKQMTRWQKPPFAGVGDKAHGLAAETAADLFQPIA
jgi:hypothetical protein